MNGVVQPLGLCTRQDHGKPMECLREYLYIVICGACQPNQGPRPLLDDLILQRMKVAGHRGVNKVSEARKPADSGRIIACSWPTSSPGTQDTCRLVVTREHRVSDGRLKTELPGEGAKLVHYGSQLKYDSNVPRFTMPRQFSIPSPCSRSCI